MQDDERKFVMAIFSAAALQGLLANGVAERWDKCRIVEMAFDLAADMTSEADKRDSSDAR